MLAGEGDDLFVEIEIDGERGRIGREIQNHRRRRRHRVLYRVGEFAQEIRLRRHRHMADRGAGDDEAVGVDRIGRVRARG